MPTSSGRAWSYTVHARPEPERCGLNRCFAYFLPQLQAPGFELPRIPSPPAIHSTSTVYTSLVSAQLPRTPCIWLVPTIGIRPSAHQRAPATLSWAE